MSIFPTSRQYSLDIMRKQEIAGKNWNKLFLLFKKYALFMKGNEGAKICIQALSTAKMFSYAKGKKEISEKDLTTVGNKLKTSCNMEDSIQIGAIQDLSKNKEYDKLKRCSLQKEITSLARINPKEHDWIKTYACNAAYTSWSCGDPLPAVFKKDGTVDEKTHYICSRVIRTREGLGISVFVPIGNNAKNYHPLVLVRGTRFYKGAVDTSNLKNDLAKNIGEKSYRPHENRIRELLKELAVEYKPAIIAGHSLGGKIAQLIHIDNFTQNIAEIPLIDKTYHFNSAPLEQADLYRYQENKKKFKGKLPTCLDYHMGRDLVHMLGPHIATRTSSCYNQAVKNPWNLTPTISPNELQKIHGFYNTPLKKLRCYSVSCQYTPISTYFLQAARGQIKPYAKQYCEEKFQKEYIKSFFSPGIQDDRL